jgi:predicted ATPase
MKLSKIYFNKIGKELNKVNLIHSNGENSKGKSTFIEAFSILFGFNDSYYNK